MVWYLVRAHTHTLTWCMTIRKFFSHYTVHTYSKQIKSKHSRISSHYVSTENTQNHIEKLSIFYWIDKTTILFELIARMEEEIPRNGSD